MPGTLPTSGGDTEVKKAHVESHFMEIKRKTLL